MKRRLSVLLVTLVICTLVAGPALAAPPERASVTVQEVFPVQVCPAGFTVVARLYETIDGKLFANNDGTYRWEMKVRGEGIMWKGGSPPVYTLPVDVNVNWQTYTSSSDFPPTVGYANVILAQRTGGIRVSLPHGGIVYMDMGRAVFNFLTGEIFMAGQHPQFTGEVVEKLCAAFE